MSASKKYYRGIFSCKKRYASTAREKAERDEETKVKKEKGAKKLKP